jgi:hypothetical protein
MTPIREVVLRLTFDECLIAADALEEVGLVKISFKLISATKPKATWINYFGKWKILCSPKIKEGDIVFVQRKDTGIREVVAGKKLDKKGTKIVRDYKRMAINR